MSYHLKVKKRPNKKILAGTILGVVVALFVIATRIFFPSALFKAVEPVAVFLWNIKENISKTNLVANFRSKNMLETENKELRKEINELKSVRMENIVLSQENKEIKEAWGRKVYENTILARVLVKPGESPYDTIIVDAGSNKGIKEGMRVFAPGGTLLGFVESYANRSSVIRLLSDPSMKIDTTLSRSGITLSLQGKGAGNFEVLLPKTTEIAVGDVVVEPGLSSRPIAQVEAIDVTEADSFQKLYLGIPTNIFELTWVEVLVNEEE